jgi:hypothetical protein
VGATSRGERSFELECVPSPLAGFLGDGGPPGDSLRRTPGYATFAAARIAWVRPSLFQMTLATHLDHPASHQLGGSQRCNPGLHVEGECLIYEIGSIVREYIGGMALIGGFDGKKGNSNS